MTLIVTPGDPSAQSLASLVEAEAYMASILAKFKPLWVAASDPDKEAMLIQASRSMVSLPWMGSRATQAQPMAWPRIPRLGRSFYSSCASGWLSDPDGYPIPSGTIPTQVKNACCEFAFRLLSADRTADAGALVRYGSKLGPISDPDRIERHPIPASVMDMVAPFLMFDPRSGGELVRA